MNEPTRDGAVALSTGPDGQTSGQPHGQTGGQRNRQDGTPNIDRRDRTADGSAATSTPGLAALRARFADGPPVGVGELLGMRPSEIEHGRVAFNCTTKPSFSNPMGTVHGGIIATMLDSAAGCAVQTVLGEGLAYTTLTLELKYLRAVALDAGELTATGVVVHAGRRQATAEARLTDRDDRLLATATSTCIILP